MKETFYRIFPAASLPPPPDEPPTSALPSDDDEKSTPDETTSVPAFDGDRSNNIYCTVTGSGVKWQSSAIQALQEGAEAFMIGMFHDANEHASKKRNLDVIGDNNISNEAVPVTPIDLQEVIQLRNTETQNNSDCSSFTRRNITYTNNDL